MLPEIDMSAAALRPPPPASVREIPKAYASSPPVIRERIDTLNEEGQNELRDEIEEAPISTIRVKAPSPLAVVSSAVFPDPAEVLFDTTYELEFVETTLEAAQVCASALLRALGARSVMVHFYDARRRELRVMAAYGASADEVVGSVENVDDDLTGGAALCNEKTVSIELDGALPRTAARRLERVGARSLVVATPAMVSGRCVALVEAIDPDPRFSGRAAESARYVADRFAEFVEERAI